MFYDEEVLTGCVTMGVLIVCPKMEDVLTRCVFGDGSGHLSSMDDDIVFAGHECVRQDAEQFVERVLRARNSGVHLRNYSLRITFGSTVPVHTNV